MTEYKIVGIMNLVVGILQLAVSAALVLFVEPQLYKNYVEMDLPHKSNTIFYVLSLILASFNFWLFNKLFKKKPESKYYKIGILTAIISFVLFGMLISFISSNLLGPIYGLANETRNLNRIRSK